MAVARILVQIPSHEIGFQKLEEWELRHGLIRKATHTTASAGAVKHSNNSRKTHSCLPDRQTLLHPHNFFVKANITVFVLLTVT